MKLRTIQLITYGLSWVLFFRIEYHWIDAECLYAIENLDALFLIGAFGASAVLLFGMTNSPTSQPSKLIFGSLISAFIGVSAYKQFSSTEYIWISPALAVSLSILAMQYTKTLQPLGGAIA